MWTDQFYRDIVLITSTIGFIVVAGMFGFNLWEQDAYGAVMWGSGLTIAAANLWTAIQVWRKGRK